jgi:hypothetical protein
MRCNAANPIDPVELEELLILWQIMEPGRRKVIIALGRFFVRESDTFSTNNKSLELIYTKQ